MSESYVMVSDYGGDRSDDSIEVAAQGMFRARRLVIDMVGCAALSADDRWVPVLVVE